MDFLPCTMYTDFYAANLEFGANSILKQDPKFQIQSESKENTEKINLKFIENWKDRNPRRKGRKRCRKSKFKVYTLHV